MGKNWYSTHVTIKLEKAQTGLAYTVLAYTGWAQTEKDENGLVQAWWKIWKDCLYVSWT